MKIRPVTRLCLIPVVFLASWALGDLPAGYRGLAFADSVYKGGPQRIPGRLQTTRFDLGGEGIAYHDTGPSNEGSGNLNKRGCPDNAAFYVCRFREGEGADISYTKSTLDYLDADRSRHPPLGQNYIGWEENGEWLNYTVNVAASGIYRIAALHGSLVREGAFNTVSLGINGKESATLKLRKTGGPHFWTLEDSVGVIHLKEAGIQLLTLNISFGNNIGYLDFIPTGATPVPVSAPFGVSARGRETGNRNGSTMNAYRLPGSAPRGIMVFDVCGRGMAWSPGP